MQKFLFLLIFSISNLGYSQSDTTKYWSSVERLFHGSTNQVKAIKSDDDGNIYYSGYGYEINSQASSISHALIVGKLDDNLNYLWKNEFFGYPTSNGLQSIQVDENNIYIAGRFITSMTFGDTTYTMNGTSNPETFIVCLDATNGNLKWSRNMGRQDEDATVLHLDGNGDLVLSYAARSGQQIYNGEELGVVNNQSSLLRGYAFITVNGEDGSVINSCFGINDRLGEIDRNFILGRTVHSVVIPRRDFFDPHQLELRTLDLNTNTVTFNQAKILFGPNNISNTEFIPKDSSWIIFVKHQNGDIPIDGETILNPTNISNVNDFTSALKFDANLELLDYITFSSELSNEYSVLKDSLLVFSFGAKGDGYILKNGEVIDTARFKGERAAYQNGHFIASCNLDFENFQFSRFSVFQDNQGWGTGMEVRGVEIDNEGNIYSAAFHDQDVIALPDTIDAFGKSWKHLSVLAKLNKEDYSITSVQSINKTDQGSVTIYPNPVKDILNISSEEPIKKVFILNNLGQVISYHNQNTIETSHLSSGLYYLLVETTNFTQTIKFLKQN